MIRVLALLVLPVMAEAQALSFPSNATMTVEVQIGGVRRARLDGREGGPDR